MVVVGAVFLGSRLWHGVFGSGDDYAGDGGKDVVIEVHNGDSTTTIGQTLHDDKVVATVKVFVEAAAKQRRDLRDPARLLQGAHRDSRGRCRCATC